jgi:branched-chain amino acid transport system permease protein
VLEPAVIAQTLLLSLTVAALYAAVASGLTLEFGVTRIINFAHGEFVMLGAFITYFLNVLYGVHPLIGMLVSAVAMGALSLVVYYGFLARVLRQDEHDQILATLGLSILILNLAIIWWSPDARVMHAPNLLPSIDLWGVTIPGNNVLLLVVGTLLYVGLFLFMSYTRYGVQLRLASDDPALAVYTGIDVDRMFALSFVIGGLTAGVAGGLVAVSLYVQPSVGIDLVVRAFAIVALGGLGSVPGALIGAALLSVAEGLTSTFVSHGASWGYGVAFLIIVLVLLVRPTGLFGKEMRA